MKKSHLEGLKVLMHGFLEDCDNDGGNPEWCYQALADDMAKAAALVYDSCMSGQIYLKQQQRRE